MKKIMNSIFWLLIAGGVVLVVSCNGNDDDDDDDVGTFSVESITGSGTDLETGEPVSEIDLYGATSATGVPLDMTIAINFSSAVEASTVSDTTIIVSGGSVDLTRNVSVEGEVITVSFEEELERGTDYTVTLTPAISGTNGASLNQGVTFTFRSAGLAEVNPPQADNMTFYMNFNGDLGDATGNYEVGTNELSGFEVDRFGFAASAGEFNGNGDIIDIEDSETLLSESMTISFWMKVDAADSNKTTHNFSVMGAAAERGFFIEVGGSEESSWIKPVTSHINSEGNSGTAWSDAINGGGVTNEVTLIAFEGDVSALIDDQWVQFVLTYDAATSIKTIYLDGEIVRQEDFTNQDPNLLGLEFNETGVEDLINKNIGIGFYGSSQNAATDWADYNAGGPQDPRTFSGLLDDIRFWNVALTEEEVTELFDAEAP